MRQSGVIYSGLYRLWSISRVNLTDGSVNIQATDASKINDRIISSGRSVRIDPNGSIFDEYGNYLFIDKYHFQH